jgi:putative phage-type endonuclease
MEALDTSSGAPTKDSPSSEPPLLPGVSATRHEGREEWLAARSKGIGASEVAAVLGWDPWTTPYKLWLRKTEKLEGQEESFAMRVGSLAEPMIEQIFLEDHPDVEVAYDPGPYTICRHEKVPHLFATPDRLIQCSGSWQNLQLKMTSVSQEDRWADNWPRHYKAQCQVELLCTGLLDGWIACLVGNRRLAVFRYTRCEQFLDQIEEKVAEFMQLVRADIPPETFDVADLPAVRSFQSLEDSERHVESREDWDEIMGVHARYASGFAMQKAGEEMKKAAELDLRRHKYKRLIGPTGERLTIARNRVFLKSTHGG